ncbi:MAG: hypothetical protein K8R39_11880 [Arcobacteraceae bacterium]|nr:hypothetical protein [Arcobacteraceae bacterium]
MLSYFIIFTIVGFVINKINQDNESQAFGIIIVVAVIWGIAYAPIWGLASLGEMALGYFIAKQIK